MVGGLVELLARQSDPANLALLAVVWWRLDRRLRQLRTRLDNVSVHVRDERGPLERREG